MPNARDPLPAQSIVALLVAIGCSSCASVDDTRRLVTRREIAPIAGPPRISSVIDVGAPDLSRARSVPLDEQDGVAVIGELLLVTGDEFGRQPRVNIDGRAARIVARTARGVVVAVPWGVRPGMRAVELRTVRGTASKPYELRRFALATVPSRDEIYPFTVTHKGIQRTGPLLKLPGANRVRFSADGRIAYVSGRHANGELVIAVVDMVRKVGPQLIRSFRIPGRHLLALSAAERAPLAVALSDTHAVFLETSDPSRPALYAPQPLPADLAAELTAADMDAEGRVLAALLAKGNELRLYDVSHPGRLVEIARTRVLPRANVPLVRDLRFASDTSTIWVISGDRPESRKHGLFPLQLTVVKIHRQEGARTRSMGVLSVWRSLDVPHRAAPVGLAVARGQPTAGGTTVPVPPQNAAVFITAHDSKLLGLSHARLDDRRGLRLAARLLRGISPVGTVVRTDIYGRGGPMFSSPSLLGRVEITSDSQLLLVGGARLEIRQRPASVRLIYGVSSTRVFGEHEPRFTALAEVDPEALARPFLLGDVSVQP